MRSWIAGITAVVAAMLVSSANAATVSALWTSVNGAPIVPTAWLSVMPGDSVTATIYLDGTADGGINAYSISLWWDGGALPTLGGASAVEFLPPGFSLNFTGGVVSVTDSAAGVRGEILGYEAGCLFCVVNGNFAVGTASFTVVNPVPSVLQSAIIQPGGADDITATLLGTSVAATSLFGSAAINIPEPATASLLGLGLLGLALARRRR